MKRLCLALLLGLVTTTLFAAGETLERYALITGSNVGSRGTTALKYASGDAKRFQEVLNRLGGLKEENSLLLVNPGKENMLQGLAFLRSKIKKNRQEGRQVQFVFYYSGHSDERSLLLGGERLDYEELKGELEKTGADVRIVVLDSCASGAFTRTKGGQIGAPFLKDLSTQVEGHAFLTSSTAEELSQESDRIESSFFTHALIEGLRGAADANGDGKVTLNEAYEYAYSQTTADTQSTSAGTQHPAYDIQLNGKGNLVMTDLRSGGATLIFPKDMRGKITIRDIANKLLAEVQKTADQELTLGIDEGYYRISWEDRGILSETTSLVDEARAYPIQLALFQGVDKTTNRTRGEDDQSPAVRIAPIGVGVGTAGGIDNVNFNLLGGQSQTLDGVMFGLFFNRTTKPSSGIQLTYVTNIAGSDFAGFQGTFGLNLAGGDFIGVQHGWVFNDVAGRMAGLQVGSINHIGGTLNLGQLGFVNLLDGDGRYLQFGVWNQANAGFAGVQAGFLVNVARSINGVQFGLFNYSEEQNGVQFGLINVSKKLNGIPIGLIDIQFNGQNHIDQTFGITSGRWEDMNQDILSTTTARLGSEYFYKYFAVQTRLAYTGENETLPAVTLGAGLGLRLPLLFPGLALHLDGGSAYTINDPSLDRTGNHNVPYMFVPQFRTFATWGIVPSFGLIAGWDHPVYTENYHPEFDTRGKVHIPTAWGNLYVDSRFFLGIQL